MPERFRHPSAEQHLEELRAEAKLAEMDFLEEAAVLAESEGPPVLRRHLSERYRAAVGVRPEDRGELRSALERVKAGGGMPVQDVVNSINTSVHANGSV